MKKIFLLLTIGFTLILASCVKDENTLTIGVNFYPMPEIIELIKDDLKADGITINTVQMDYNVLNTPLLQGEIDGNLIQHQYFMNFFNQANNGNLVIAQRIYHSKFALYSSVFASIDDIPSNTTIYIPEDIVNISRALILLDDLGLITLAEGKTTDSKLSDITSNPKGLIFQTKSLGTTAQAYHSDGGKLAIMYPSYARTPDNQLMDDSEVIAYEELNELTMTYAISFVTREDNLNDPKIQKLITHLTSPKVANWITENYGWAAIPAF